MNFSGLPGGGTDGARVVTERSRGGPGACSGCHAEYLLCRVRRLCARVRAGPGRRLGVAYATLHGPPRYEVDHVWVLRTRVR